MRPGVVNRRAVWVAVLALLAVLATLFCAVWVIPRLLDPPLSMAALRGVASAQQRIQLQQAQSQLANNARTTILQGLAGLVLVAGALATWWQVHIGRQGQITDRYSKAVDQLASPSVEVRIGSIYAMERIAKNSAADRDAILFLLGAFVRIHSPWPVGAPDGPQHPTATVDENLPWMRVRAPDIQAAMGTLGRLPRSREEPPISLSRVDLRSVALQDSRLNGSRFRYTNLARSALSGVWLEDADLTGADLRLANLDHARLAGANLSRASLQGASLRHADLRHANLRAANLSNATLDAAQLVGSHADQITTWPDGFDLDQRHQRGIIENGT
jgi:hypothetical protein